MLKLAGICILLSGCIGYGGTLCRLMREHLKMLLTFKEIFIQIDAQRSYICIPYSQILTKCAKGKPDLFTEILIEAAARLEESEEADTKKIFTEVVEERERALAMTKEEKEIVVELFRSLQIEGEGKKVSEMYFMQLEEKIVQAMAEQKEKQKIYQSVSIMAGIFFIILLF